MAHDVVLCHAGAPGGTGLPGVGKKTEMWKAPKLWALSIEDPFEIGVRGCLGGYLFCIRAMRENMFMSQMKLLHAGEVHMPTYIALELASDLKILELLASQLTALRPLLSFPTQPRYSTTPTVILFSFV